MKDAVYHWLEQLACYLVLVTAVIHTLPDSGYKKYVRFFTGLILILLLASPVLKLFQVDADEWRFHLDEEYMTKMEEIEGMTEEFKDREMEEEEGKDNSETEKEALVEVEEIRVGR